MSDEIVIYWFRQDLRLADNVALSEAAKNGKVLPIYILDDCAPPGFKLGHNSRGWLHRSLKSLNEALDGKLSFYEGSSDKVIEKLLSEFNVKGVYANCCFEPWHVAQEVSIDRLLKKQGVEFALFNSNYLWEPDEVLKDDQSYYKVFTAYKRKAYTKPIRSSVGVAKLSLVESKRGKNLEALKLEVKSGVFDHWEVGEEAAKDKLSRFLSRGLKGYKLGRDIPAICQTSYLSPHLHFGEVSPLQIWEGVQKQGRSEDTEHFLSELTWREFSVYLMYHFQGLYKDNFVAKFDKFPWETNTKFLKAWQEGKTGYPIVDAGMRQLKETGYMHNRVRMIVASFLIKNLNIHWHKGRDWFWENLVDADLGNNSASWQWVAGCGADAAPYFRIFNPITQGEKFDKHGEYTKKYVPELKNVPDKYLFKPWMAKDEVLEAAGVELGKDYPEPIVDLSTTRNRALNNYKYL